MSPCNDKIDPHGSRLPIKLDTASNGEFVPVPLSRANRLANRLAHEFASAHAKKLGLGRRSFLVSACGAASTLLAFNRANAAAGKTGGYFELPREAALEPVAARSVLDKGEFIFDVQGHFIDTPKGNSKGPDVFIKDVFLDSDTDMMVLSFVPSRRDAEPVTIQAADAVRAIVERMEGSKRLLVHGRVNPNQPGDLEAMDELKEKWGVCAWKTYTQFGPEGNGYFLSDETGTRLVERARRLGVKVICVHKGLPFGPRSYQHSQCSDGGFSPRKRCSPRRWRCFPPGSSSAVWSGSATRAARGCSRWTASRSISARSRSLRESMPTSRWTSPTPRSSCSPPAPACARS